MDSGANSGVLRTAAPPRRGGAPILVVLGAVLGGVALFAWLELRERRDVVVAAAPSPRSPRASAPAVAPGSDAPPTGAAPLDSAKRVEVAPPRSKGPAGEGGVPWLRVRVTDTKSGAPIPYIRVHAAATAQALAAEGDDVTVDVTDSKGIAALAEPPPGLGSDLPWILAAARDHAPALLPLTRAVPSGTHAFCVRGRTIELPLARAQPLVVNVFRRGESGEPLPIAGARVVARAPWAEEAEWFAEGRSDTALVRLLTFDGVTDEGGRASFVPLARQPLRLHVGATGFDSQDLVLSAAQAKSGKVDVELTELWAAALIVPDTRAFADPALRWDDAPAWDAPSAIHLLPDHLTPEERADATTTLALREGIARALPRGSWLRCRFATLGSVAFADPRPYDVPGRLFLLPGDEPVDVTLPFAPFAALGARDLFDPGARAPGEPGLVRFTWKDPPAPATTMHGTLIRNEASGDPIEVRETVHGFDEVNLRLPEGHYHLVGEIGGCMLLASFDLAAGEGVGIELTRSNLLSGHWLSSRPQLPPLEFHDELGRPRLRYVLTITPSDAPPPDFAMSPTRRGHVLSRSQSIEPGDIAANPGLPFELVDRLGLGFKRDFDLVVEAFGCATTEFVRVPMGGREVTRLELQLDEAPTSSW